MVNVKFQGESLQGGPDGTVEIVYVISEAPTRDAALVQLLTSPLAPLTVSHAVFGMLQREKVPNLEEVDAGQGYWVGTVRWVRLDFSGADVPDPVVSFDTTGGTAHITTSKETVASKGLNGLAAPNHKTLIGVDHDGQPQGCDIVVPTYTWTETHRFPQNAVNAAYRKVIRGLTGKVNAQPFRDYAAGEALFMGASGTRPVDPSALWEVAFKFGGSDNVVTAGTEEAPTGGIKIADLPRVSKKGWEYIWSYTRRVDDLPAGAMASKPIAVYVERVYDSGNFGALNLPAFTG